MGDRILKALAIIATLAGVASAGPAGRVAGKVTLTDADGKPATAVVIVYVVGFPEPGTGKRAADIVQKDRKFVPDLVAITVGESVSFPNGDQFLHNVFSQSPPRPFDLGSFKHDQRKDKDFPTPGVVDVYCNIHPEMAATILVLPNKRHTQAAPDGSYAIDGVPPGTWTVFAYSRRAAKPASARVTVTAGADTTANLALLRGAEREHLNKYGEKYHEPTTTYR
ncbi:MAG: Copper binding protein plastocyanin/azurin family [Myxococcales bacterium]|nr:Copper binding protein plastocyanin/azurin family [Myxococcales bacterium]